eukprot:SAG31_NODE_47254_length_251_cov_0.677632_1_plen_40_part_01
MTEVGPAVLQGVARVLHKYPFVHILVRNPSHFTNTGIATR